MGRDLGSRCDWSLRRGLSQRGVARPSPGHLQLLIPAPPGPPHSPLIPEGLGKSWGAVPLWRTCGPTVRAADAEAGTWARTPGGLCGVGVRGEVHRLQLCTVGRGASGGWTPGICFPHGIPNLLPAAPRALGPGEDVPRSCQASGCGGPGPGWADGLAPTASAPRYCSPGAPAHGWTPGAGALRSRLGQMF